MDGKRISLNAYRVQQVMKKYLIIILLIVTSNVFAQGELVKDLDGDGIKDTIRIEYVLQNDIVSENHSYILCRLSSRQFEEMRSQKIFIDYWSFLEIRSGITSTRNGFEFFVNYTRNGEKAQFRYDKQTQKIQLIGMSRYEIGLHAEGDGKGKSSVNLLTGYYIGDWYALSPETDKLLKIPTIKVKMDFGKIYLEDFNEDVLSDYASRCSDLRYEQKVKILSIESHNNK